MNLSVDIGNTKIKFALFDGQSFVKKGSGDEKELDSFIKNGGIENAIVSSVAKSKEVKSILKKNNIDFLNLSHKTPIPIINNYTTPKTLGDDRLANVIGAQSLFPEKNVLTIDCGTCIKFDSISKGKEYQGGAISPGLVMRFKALNKFTNALPELSPESIDFLIGNSSENSILSGVINGCIQEIDGIIGQYESIYENLTVILTGGDAKFFDKELKSNIFVESNLTLIGLNEILLHNHRP